MKSGAHSLRECRALSFYQGSRNPVRVQCFGPLRLFQGMGWAVHGRENNPVAPLCSESEKIHIGQRRDDFFIPVSPNLAGSHVS